MTLCHRREALRGRADRVHAARGRRGVVLVVVLAMLQLFALVGIAFVSYASRHDHPADVERVVQEIELARSNLLLLSQNPEDPDLQARTLVVVHSALCDSKRLLDRLDPQPDPELRSVRGLLRAADAIFERLKDAPGR